MDPLSVALSLLSTLGGVLLGHRLARRSAEDAVSRGLLIDLRRLLSRELDAVLLVQRRAQHETGSLTEAIEIWARVRPSKSGTARELVVSVTGMQDIDVPETFEGLYVRVVRAVQDL